MTPNQAIQHFGDQKAVAKFSNRTKGAVSQWVKAGKIPPLAQLLLEQASNGVLMADDGIPRGHKGRKRK